MNYSDKLQDLAQGIADNTPRFFEIKGYGLGDKATIEFMKELRSQAIIIFQEDFSEKKICGDNNLSVDFYFPSESTVVEVALSLRNSNSEFERDILKTILGRKSGYAINKLVFISKHPAIKRRYEPASRSIIDLVQREFGITVIITELVNNHTI
jgi:hypothetical protein